MALATAAAYLSQDRLLVEWHLWRLETGDAAAQIQAAEGLGEMRAVRAAPRLLQGLGADATSYRRALESRGGWMLMPGDLDAHLSAAGRTFKLALIRIGAPATAHILRAVVHEKDAFVALHWTGTLLEIHGTRYLAREESVLRGLRDDPAQSEDTRRLAALRLESRRRR